TRAPPTPPLFPYTTLFRSKAAEPAKLTALGMLRRSADAMKPPIRCKVVCNGVTFTVSQKVAFDGLTATRMETASPIKRAWLGSRSEEHTSELQSLRHLVCR